MPALQFAVLCPDEAKVLGHLRTRDSVKLCPVNSATALVAYMAVQGSQRHLMTRQVPQTGGDLAHQHRIRTLRGCCWTTLWCSTQG